MPANQPAMSQRIEEAHSWFNEATGQTLSLRYDRERLWQEWFHAGFNLHDLRSVIIYLRREIREGRRNAGSLKLTNILQPDRFEEDLNLMRVQLRGKVAPLPGAPAPLRPPQSDTLPESDAPMASQEQRDEWAAQLRTLRERMTSG